MGQWTGKKGGTFAKFKEFLQILILLPQRIFGSLALCMHWVSTAPNPSRLSVLWFTWSSSQKFPRISYYYLLGYSNLQACCFLCYFIASFCLFVCFPNILVKNEFASSLSCLYKIRQENGEQTPGKSCLKLYKKTYLMGGKTKTYLSQLWVPLKTDKQIGIRVKGLRFDWVFSPWAYEFGAHITK